jgi:hypothetical protein
MLVAAEVRRLVLDLRGHEIPAGPAAADMVDRQEAARRGIGVVRGRGTGRGSADILGDHRQRARRVMGRAGPTRGTIGAGAIARGHGNPLPYEAAVSWKNSKSNLPRVGRHVRDGTISANDMSDVRGLPEAGAQALPGRKHETRFKFIWRFSRLHALTVRDRIGMTRVRSPDGRTISKSSGRSRASAGSCKRTASGSRIRGRCIAAMLAQIAKRLYQAMVVMIVVAMIAFASFRFLGDPVGNNGRAGGDPEEKAPISAELGLADPLPVQFLRFVVNALHGELGRSYQLRQRSPS